MITPLTDTQIIDAIISREGGYVDHPADRGGPTNFGITLAKLREWRGVQNLTANDVRMMRRGEAALMYPYFSGGEVRTVGAVDVAMLYDSGLA